MAVRAASSSGAGAASNPAIFGTGSDGNVTISSGTTTLTRDMNYNNLTISGTGSIVPNGWIIYVAGTLDLSAAGAKAINGSGAAGSNGVGGVVVSTSTTSLTIGTGTQTLTIATGLPWTTALPYSNTTSSLLLWNSSTQNMLGQLTSYDPSTGTLVANIVSVGGVGLFSNWTVYCGLRVVGATGVTIALNGLLPGTSGSFGAAQTYGTTAAPYPGAGSAGNNGSAQNNVRLYGGNGGASGAGGAGSTGTPGSAGSPSYSSGFSPYLGTQLPLLYVGSNSAVAGGLGSYGGSSGPDGTNSGVGGTSGTGGQYVCVRAFTLARGTNTTAGIISAVGGIAGNGYSQTSGNAGGSGAAGGAGGGVVDLLVNSVTGSAITNGLDASGSAGGNGGSGFGTGLAGGGGTGGNGGAIRYSVLSTNTTTFIAGNSVAGSAPSGATGGAGGIAKMNL